MKYNFDKIIDRRSSDSIKWNLFDADVLPLWVADMDFPSPPEVINALRNRIDHRLFGYTKTQESTRRSVQKWMLNRHGWKIETEDILMIPGVVQAFNVAAAAFSQPGDSVLIQTPAYHPFFDIRSNVNLKQSISPLLTDSNGCYRLDSPSFKNALLPGTRIFMLCNPHNPTGRVFSKSELLSIAQSCQQNNTIICSDEIHSDITYSGFKHTPIGSLSPEIAQNTVTLVSTTKTFNLAGLKSSAVIIPNPRLRELFSRQLSGFVGSVNILGETALSAAYDNGSEWLEQLLCYLENNRQFLLEFISSELPLVDIYPPEGTYLAWLNCSNLDLPNPGEFFLNKARVGLNSGEWFGVDYSGHVRLNFACPLEILAEALDRMKGAILSR